MSSSDAETAGCLVVLNAGSSSLKFATYDASPGEPLIFRGKLEELGTAPRLRVEDMAGRPVAERSWNQPLDHKEATRQVVGTVVQLSGGRPVVGVGHRVAHGGVRYAEPVRIDRELLSSLADLIPLAPLHQPHNLAPIEAIAAAAPHIPQVACFDTAFHRTQPHLAQMFALPRRFTDEGVRRYGFHGLSYQYVSSRMRELAPHLAYRRMLIAHLGSGASLCGVCGGRSVASTMGFTAVDGLMMGTRAGALDPGVLIHLMDTYGMDARALETLIYKQSGLLGVSGVSSDMRVLRASPEAAAAEAIELFVYRVVREIGSIAAAMNGVDALVFTGGIGENDPQIRAAIAAGCAWLGLELGDDQQQRGARRISASGSRVEAWVVPTDEERIVARHTAALLGLGRSAAAPWASARRRAS